MVWVFSGLAFLCMVYYLVIIIYAGLSTSWSFIWLLAAGIFILLAAGVEYWHNHKDTVPLWIPVSALTAVSTGAVALLVTEILIFTGTAAADPKGMDYVIVLGAQVKGEELSDSLKKRLDKVISYAEENPEAVFILSGGMGPGEYLSEAEAMYGYLVYNGIPAEKLVKEPNSTSTLENIGYSKVLIDAMENLKKSSRRADEEYEEPKIGVLTSNFHVFRAKQIAQKRGIPQVYGLKADSNPLLFVHLCIREALAVWKDKLMGNM